MVQSRALEVNIADYHVDVAVDPKYAVLQEAFARYYGLQESLTTFLKELSHPYKNWEFIVKEARSYSLDYFHLLQGHPRGPEAAEARAVPLPLASAPEQFSDGCAEQRRPVH